MKRKMDITTKDAKFTKKKVGHKACPELVEGGAKVFNQEYPTLRGLRDLCGE